MTKISVKTIINSLRRGFRTEKVNSFLSAIMIIAAINIVTVGPLLLAYYAVHYVRGHR
jgi:hypothetical protein